MKMIRILQTSNFLKSINRYLRYRGKHTAPVALPQTVLVADIHGKIVSEDFSWLQDINCPVSVLIRFTCQFLTCTSVMYVGGMEPANVGDQNCLVCSERLVASQEFRQ